VPRIDEGRRLNELGLCCGDISDGLVREMEKFAAMAGVGCKLQAERVHRVPGASVEDALTSGEEAELVVVGPADAIAAAGLAVVVEWGERLDVDGALHIAIEHLGGDRRLIRTANDDPGH